MMEKILHLQFLVLSILFMTSGNSYADSGGPLSPEQAAYDVIFYDLDLSIDPTTKTINGSLLCRAEILSPINTFVLDLDDLFVIDSVLFKLNDENFSNATFAHTDGKVNTNIPGSVISGVIDRCCLRAGNFTETRRLFLLK